MDLRLQESISALSDKGKTDIHTACQLSVYTVVANQRGSTVFPVSTMIGFSQALSFCAVGRNVNLTYGGKSQHNGGFLIRRGIVVEQSTKATQMTGVSWLQKDQHASTP